MSLEAAINHLVRYGDTDIFPHLPELAFFSDEKAAIIDELAKLDLDTYTPAGAIEALAPKARYSFRIAHQLSALDTVLLSACVIDIGDKIEAKRQPVNSIRTFSYRFSLESTRGGVFRDDRTFKDWLRNQQRLLVVATDVTHVVCTDISDYYSRISFHRLENLLDEAAPRHGAVRFIKRHIGIIRAKQSFGLPVGGSAARLLAELALVDTDEALRNMGLTVTRFVDDFRIFLKATDHPYNVLGFLAGQLGINEGLSLNAAKTVVIGRDEYGKNLHAATSDLEEEAEDIALDELTAGLYFDAEPDEEDLEKLKGLNLVEMLEKEIDGHTWDMGRVKVLFRALKIVKPEKAIDLITQRFEGLAIFGRELVLLMEVLEGDNFCCFDKLAERVIEAVVSPPASSIEIIRTWLLEIFMRNIITVSPAQLKKLEALPTVIDKKQLLLIRSRCKDVNFFRRQKTAVQSFSDIERPYLVWGASCLPQDEYEVWLQRTVGVHMNRPLDGLFLKWAAKNRSRLMLKLKAVIAEHPE